MSRSSSVSFAKIFRFALCLSVAFLLVAGSSQAVIISHVPNDRVPPVVKSPPFGPLAPGGEVGAAFIDFGVDYTFGGVEGIFDNGGGDEGTFGGVNAANILDLLSPVDGRIVVPGTLNQGLTSFISVEAGFAADGTLRLDVFDINGILLASALNGPPLGPHGRTTMTISRGGVFDIASFVVSSPGEDTYGVNQIDLEMPQGVPEPTGLLLVGLGALGLWGYERRGRRPR